jgi:hypothetical protein
MDDIMLAYLLIKNYHISINVEYDIDTEICLDGFHWAFKPSFFKLSKTRSPGSEDPHINYLEKKINKWKNSEKATNLKIANFNTRRRECEQMVASLFKEGRPAVPCDYELWSTFRSLLPEYLSEGTKPIVEISDIEHIIDSGKLNDCFSVFTTVIFMNYHGPGIRRKKVEWSEGKKINIKLFSIFLINIKNIKAENNSLQAIINENNEATYEEIRDEIFETQNYKHFYGRHIATPVSLSASKIVKDRFSAKERFTGSGSSIKRTRKVKRTRENVEASPESNLQEDSSQKRLQFQRIEAQTVKSSKLPPALPLINETRFDDLSIPCNPFNSEQQFNDEDDSLYYDEHEIWYHQEVFMETEAIDVEVSACSGDIGIHQDTHEKTYINEEMENNEISKVSLFKLSLGESFVKTKYKAGFQFKRDETSKTIVPLDVTLHDFNAYMKGSLTALENEIESIFDLEEEIKIQLDKHFLFKECDDTFYFHEDKPKVYGIIGKRDFINIVF